MSDKPTRDITLPFGCIGSNTLRLLANAMEKLTAYHTRSGGKPSDRPCLRRIEAAGDVIEAHVSTGPAIGGAWVVFVLTPNGRRIRD